MAKHRPGVARTRRRELVGGYTSPRQVGLVGNINEIALTVEFSHRRRSLVRGGETHATTPKHVRLEFGTGGTIEQCQTSCRPDGHILIFVAVKVGDHRRTSHNVAVSEMGESGRYAPQLLAVAFPGIDLLVVRTRYNLGQAVAVQITQRRRRPDRVSSANRPSGDICSVIKMECPDLRVVAAVVWSAQLTCSLIAYDMPVVTCPGYGLKTTVAVDVANGRRRMKHIVRPPSPHRDRLSILIVDSSEDPA